MGNIRYGVFDMQQTNQMFQAKLSNWINTDRNTDLQTSEGDTKDALVGVHTSLNACFDSIVTSGRKISGFLGETIEDVQKMDDALKQNINNALEAPVMK